MPPKHPKKNKSKEKVEPKKPIKRVHLPEDDRVKIFQKFRDYDDVLWGKVKGPDGFTVRAAAQKEILG